MFPEANRPRKDECDSNVGTLIVLCQSPHASAVFSSECAGGGSHPNTLRPPYSCERARSCPETKIGLLWITVPKLGARDSANCSPTWGQTKFSASFPSLLPTALPEECGTETHVFERTD
jgi:hypothetical protein